MKHSIPDNTRNSDLIFCIDEYVRNIEHREMLKDWWFSGCTLDQLTEKYHKSLTSVKDIVYNIGDPILLRAEKRSERREMNNL